MPMRMLTRAALFVLLPTLAAACFGGSSANKGGGTHVDSQSMGPTFHKDIEPILQTSCQGCHAPGGIAPMALMTYEDARTYAGMIANQTQNRMMPPWEAFETDECKPRYGFKQDLRLPQQEIDLLQAWLDAGTPEGDPKDAPPPRNAALAGGLPGVQQELLPKTPYVTSGSQDEFRCFILDPAVADASKYLNGFQFVAGNPAVVHHALLFADPNRESEKLADATGSYPCFGGPGLSAPSLLSAWAPGGVPLEYPPNVGAEVKPGTLFVMQVHYHAAGAVNAAPDATKVQIRWTPSKPEYALVSALIGNFDKSLPNGDGLLPGPDDPATGPEFRIPANASAHTESMRFTLPATTSGGLPMPALSIYGSGTHMHWVGHDMKVDLEHANPTAGEPQSECLIQTPRWDFSWQRGYAYDAALDQLPVFRPGDKLTLRCTYNNTMDNPALARALEEQKLTAPRDVFLGETTLDEMCLVAVSLVYRAP